LFTGSLDDSHTAGSTATINSAERREQSTSTQTRHASVVAGIPSATHRKSLGVAVGHTVVDGDRTDG
jgi:hypothetical protein